MKHRCEYVIALFITVAALAGCDQPKESARVYIVYEQIANFYEYKLSPDSASTGLASDGMFVLYKIKQISNTGSQAKPYVFGKHKVVAVTPDKVSNEEPAGDNILLGAKLVANLTVQPAETKTNPGCIIKHVLTPNPKSLANTSAPVNLMHQIDQSQPVSMTRAAGNNTNAVVENALPSTLQNLCGN